MEQVNALIATNEVLPSYEPIKEVPILDILLAMIVTDQNNQDESKSEESKDEIKPWFSASWKTRPIYPICFPTLNILTQCDVPMLAKDFVDH